MHLLSLIWRIENDLHQTLSNGGFEKNEESMETRQSINGINNRLDSCAFKFALSLTQSQTCFVLAGKLP